jgi:hypothetical protein
VIKFQFDLPTITLQHIYFSLPTIDVYKQGASTKSACKLGIFTEIKQIGKSFFEKYLKINLIP